MPRIVKQILYGVFYIVFWAGVIWGGKLLFFTPPASCVDNIQNQDEEEVDCGGPNCASCAIRHLSAIAVQSVSVVPTAGKASVIVKLANPNPTYGASPFSYEINFYDRAHEKIFAVSKESVLYPAEQKTIVEAGTDLPIERVFGNPEVVIKNPAWKPAEELKRPNIQTRDVSTAIGGDGRITVTGLFVNTNPFGFSRIEIAAGAETAEGTIVGISETVIHDIVPFEQRAFTVIIPSVSVAAKEVAKTELFIEPFR